MPKTAREIAEENEQVYSLYRQYGLSEAARILDVHAEEINRKCRRHSALTGASFPLYSTNQVPNHKRSGGTPDVDRLDIEKKFREGRDPWDGL